MYQKRLLLLVVVMLAAALALPPSVRAQNSTVSINSLTGNFAITYPGYEAFQLEVGLADSTGLFGSDPIYLAPKDQQILGTYTGNAKGGTYTIKLPDTPKGRPVDLMGNGQPTSSVLIFDVRLLSDVAKKGYMVPNEDPIASSLKITIDSKVVGGTLLVWVADDKQQFSTEYGVDGKLFTADDPRASLGKGWSAVDLSSKPFKVTRGESATVSLITTGAGDVVDFTNLNCADLIPAFLDRVQSVYPFTDLYKIDWDALRGKMIPASKTAQSPADCQKLIRDFGNAIPDGHVNYRLPALAAEVAGSAGLRMSATDDGKMIVTLVRANSPAANAGIKLGAEITEWDGKPINEAIKTVVLQSSNAGTPAPLLDAKLRDLTRGPLGSKVSVTFQNPGESKQTAELTRDEPKAAQGIQKEAPQLKDNKLPSGMGYVKINNFTAGGALASFDSTMDQLIKDNVPAIIIDIRSNPGGLSQLADAMASRFFDKPLTISKMYTKDGRYVYVSLVDPRQPVYTGCVAVMVDMFTASSGDMFAYTFKSTGRGQIVGQTPSYGAAGTVSGGVYRLPNGASIQVPTGASFDTDNKIVVEGQGVAPDVKVPLTAESLLSPKDTVLEAAVQAMTTCGKKP